MLDAAERARARPCAPRGPWLDFISGAGLPVLAHWPTAAPRRGAPTQNPARGDGGLHREGYLACAVSPKELQQRPQGTIRRRQQGMAVRAEACLPSRRGAMPRGRDTAERARRRGARPTPTPPPTSNPAGEKKRSVRPWRLAAVRSRGRGRRPHKRLPLCRGP